MLVEASRHPPGPSTSTLCSREVGLAGVSTRTSPWRQPLFGGGPGSGQGHVDARGGIQQICIGRIGWRVRARSSTSAEGPYVAPRLVGASGERSGSGHIEAVGRPTGRGPACLRRPMSSFDSCRPRYQVPLVRAAE